MDADRKEANMPDGVKGGYATRNEPATLEDIETKYDPRHDNEGRPLFDFSGKENEIDKLGYAHASHWECAVLLGCNKETIKRHLSKPESIFCIHYNKGMARSNIELRESQLENAIEGNDASTVMQKFTGNQYLNQIEQTEQIGTAKSEPVTINISQVTQKEIDDFTAEIEKEFE